MVAVLAHSRGLIGSVTLPSPAPAPGDVLVLLTVTNHVTTPVAPSTVTGCGATWTRVEATERTSVWIGIGATSAGTITINGGSAGASAVWRLAAGVTLDVSSWGGFSVADSVPVGADAINVGPTQAVLSLAFPASTFPYEGSLPSIEAWAKGNLSSVRTAWATPAVGDTYAARSLANGARSALVQAVIGTPPPSIPFSLTLTPGLDSIDVSWEYPTGPAVTGYTVTLDGVTPIDVGNVLTHTLTGLTPSTTYTIAVRAYNAAGTGPPRTAETTTLTPVDPPGPGDYTLTVRIGDPGPDAHEWTISHGDPATYGPLAGVSIGWSAPQDQGWPAQPNAVYASVQVITETAAELGDVDQGTTLLVRFTPSPDSEELVEFAGIIRDVSSRPHELGQVTTLKALDHLLDERLNQATGTIELPYQSIPDRYAAIVELLDSPLGIPGFQAPVDTSGGFYNATSMPSTSVLKLITGYFQFADFTLDTAYFLRPNIAADGTLDVDEPFRLVNVAQSNNATPTVVDAGQVPTQSVEWNRLRLEPNTVQITGDLAAIYERPHPGIARIVVTDPPAPQGWILDAHDVPAHWGSRFRVQAHLSPDLVAGWFDLPTAMNQLVQITGIDARHNPNGTADHAGLLAGAVLTIPPGGDWYVDFDLRRSLHGPTP